jgi:adenylate cyclase
MLRAVTGPGSDGIERRLAAILSADAVGYSKLMAEDEVATLRTLEAYREEMAALVRQHRGRVVDSPGDNLLAEFPSATEAVDCAVELQRVFEARNRARPAERRMAFRMGVHLGEVIAEGERIYGDGVNIAARLERLAEPGGVCISGAVHEQVESRLEVEFQDLGEQSLKNIPKPVRAFRVGTGSQAGAPQSKTMARRRVLLAAGVLLLLVVGGLQVWKLERWRSRAPEAAAPETRLSDEELTVPGFSGAPAIAVLPFDNLSGDVEQEYFADGIAEDLITRLSSWRSFPVIARNSSFIYKGTAVDVKRVSRELGVRYLVEGSVRKRGDRVRISAQLIDATSGHHLWAETYDRELQDIFALQDEITLAVVSAIRPELRRAEIGRTLRKRPQNLDAYESKQRGWWHLWKFTREHNAEARELFERAAELDPNDAAALWGVAFSHYVDVTYEWHEARERSIAALVRAARECIALDPESSGCQVALGFAYRVTGKQDEEIAAFERAVRLDPSNAAAHGWLGMTLALSGRPEQAIANLEQALRLSPRDPAKAVFLISTAWAHFAAERYEQAVDWARRTVAEDPGYDMAYRTLAASYAHLGRLEQAREALEEELRLDPGLSLRKVRQQNPTTEPDFLARWLGGLRKAGLPEE